MEKGNRKKFENTKYSYCRLLPNINYCNYIDSILEKWCIRFVYNIFNSENQ